MERQRDVWTDFGRLFGGHEKGIAGERKLFFFPVFSFV